MRHSKGFTIVELLIVIVVIGILAAITIVAYNGIQTRAENTKTIQGFKEYVKAFHNYATDNGDYPPFAGCFGEGYPSTRCLSQVGSPCFGSTGGIGVATTDLNTALKPYMNNTTPSISMQQNSCGGTTYIGGGAIYVSATKTVQLYMTLRGDQSCPAMSPNASAPSRSFQDSATLCRYTLQAA